LVAAGSWPHAFIGLFNEDFHCLTSPMMETLPEFPYRQDQPEVCSLSGRVSLAWWPALSVRLQNGLRFLRYLLPPAPSPFLTVGIPSCDGAHGVYPVDDRGVTNQRGWSLSPGGATNVAARYDIVQPAHLPFWSQRVGLLSLFGLDEVYRLFALAQPSGSSLALSRPRLAAFGTLFLRLQTLAYAFACSSRDTWTSQGLCHFMAQHSSAALIWTVMCTHHIHTGRTS